MAGNNNLFGNGGQAEEMEKIMLSMAERLLSDGQAEKAFQTYKTIANSSTNTTAQYNLAVLYAQGRGVGRDFIEAAYWFHEVEKTGDAKAGKLVKKCEIDYMSSKMNESTPRELYEAMRKLAARVYPEEEHAARDEMTEMGIYYIDKYDYMSAAKLLRAAAEFGEAGKAQYYLGELYRAGAGVKKNDLAAAYWFDLAFRNKYKAAGEARGTIINAYRAKMLAFEAAECFERLAGWCETGTEDIPISPKSAVYWKSEAKTTRSLVSISFFINKEMYTLEFELREKISGGYDRIEPGDCVYNIGGREFQGTEALKGEVTEALETEKLSFNSSERIEAAVKENEYGDKFFYKHVSLPTFDSGDWEWDSDQRYALLFDGEKIDAISVRSGYKVGSIEIYHKLRCATGAFREYLEKMGCTKEALDDICWV